MATMLLDVVKAAENVESLLLVTDDFRARKVMVAWLLYRPVIQDQLWSGEKPHEAARILWDQNPPVDIDRLADLADLPWTYVKTTFERLKQAGMVFPDGTINATARAFIRAEVQTFTKSVLPKGVFNAAAARTDAGGPGVPESNPHGVREGHAAKPGANKGGHSKAADHARPRGRPSKKTGVR